MSHSPTIFSPAGTPLLDRTVGELVAERPGRSRVFQAADIGFCCQGSRTLRESCESKGVDPARIVAELEAEMADKQAPANNPAELPLDELCEYLLEHHHEFLRNELPRLHAMAERVAQVHGRHTPSLIEIYHVFCGMADELVTHVREEEDNLFPALTALVRGEESATAIEGKIDWLIRTHDETAGSLAKLRALSHGYNPPEEACNTYRALFDGLQDLEEDLQRHIHLENSVLFPSVRSLLKS